VDIPAASSSHYTFKASAGSSHGKLLGLLPAPGNGRRVLDLGCGPGHVARQIAERGYEVTGVEQPGAAGEGFPGTVRLVEADLDAGLPALDGRFDVAVCGDILEHLRRPDRLLGQIREVLRPDGRLLASLPNSGNIYFRLTVLSGRFPQEDRGLFDRTHVRFYTRQGWRHLFACSGYEIESIASTGIPAGLRFPRWADTMAVWALEAVLHSLAALWPSLWAYQFIVVARPSRNHPSRNHH
jgi:SAM-dependent methyltransferase